MLTQLVLTSYFFFPSFFFLTKKPRENPSLAAAHFLLGKQLQVLLLAVNTITYQLRCKAEEVELKRLM